MAVAGMSDRQELETLVVRAVREVLQALPRPALPELTQIPVGVSVRHVHPSPEDVERLFGPGYQLTPLVELQPGHYAAKETVTLVGPRGVLQNVRVLGPPRGQTQVEISRTDGYVLGLDPPVRDSGDLKGSEGVVVVGPRGAISLAEGVISAARHVHMPPAHAAALGLEHGERVRVKTDGLRPVAFDSVLIRVSEGARTEMHIDTDEANAAGLATGDRVRLVLDSYQ